jgi:ABC-2 type transport system ATP-binding protein
VAALDPLARRSFLQGLMELTAERGISVIMSSHLVADLERVCDYLIVLVASRVRVADDVDELLATHHRLVGPRRDPAGLGAGRAVVDQSHTDVQSTLVVRSTAPIDDPSWQVDRLNLEDIVLAYMSGAETAAPERVLEGRR